MPRIEAVGSILSSVNLEILQNIRISLIKCPVSKPCPRRTSIETCCGKRVSPLGETPSTSAIFGLAAGEEQALLWEDSGSRLGFDV